MKGVDHFFLYDNSESTRAEWWRDLSNPHLEVGRVNKYRIPYGEIVTLSALEISEVLEHIASEIPNVHIIKWSPKDEDGNVVYGHVDALNDALKKYGNLVDWMAFIDTDEFIVSDASLPEMADRLESKGRDGGYLR